MIRETSSRAILIFSQNQNNEKELRERINDQEETFFGRKNQNVPKIAEHQGIIK